MTKTLFLVIDGPIKVRQTPGGTLSSRRLQTGEIIETDADSRTEVDGYVWWQHADGWSAERGLDGKDVFLTEVSSADGTTIRFKVTDGPVKVRQTPNGNLLGLRIPTGQVIEVDTTSRTEVGSYVWWQHSDGWSAERSVSGRSVFMEIVTDETTSPTITTTEPSVETPAEPKKAVIPDHLKGVVSMQVAQSVKVRDRASTDSRGLVIRTISRGKVLQCDMDTLTEADGYYWLKHSIGWSAWQSTDGETVFLAEPGTIPGLVAIYDDGPRIEELPNYMDLVQRFPVALEDTQWFQYFGNNVFAIIHGKDYGYDGYSQGLHGGLDFGNSKRSGVKVLAGLEGKYMKTEASRPRNFRVFVQSGDYTIIYQHITNIPGFARDQLITPETVIGEIEHNSQGGWDHLHFEIRFMKDWIVNPIALMPEELQQQLFAQFNPEKSNSDYKKLPTVYNFFYKTKDWDKWTSPLDQPVLKLAGAVIGPRAAGA